MTYCNVTHTHTYTSKVCVMAHSQLLLCVVIVCVMVCVVTAQQSSGGCSPNCGFEASCENSTCNCSAGFTLHGNGKDCKNVSCYGVDCLQCEAENKCVRCVSFLAVSTGLCLKKCDGSAEIKSDILICTESKNTGVSLPTAIIAGVACGAALSMIVVIAVCIYTNKTRQKNNLKKDDHNKRWIESGKFPAYENAAYETDSQVALRSSKVDPLEYANELDKLRPHADTLMELLNQVRTKKRSMDSSDERVPTYKGVIHQLCRVLSLIHNRDPVVNIPSDALGLIHWAQKMLQDRREQQNNTSGSLTDFNIAQISSIDLDFDNPNNPVYATPERSQVGNLFSTSSHSIATPYSSVPVLLSEVEQQHYGTGKQPGFATISRARAKPHSDLIRALEADLNNTNNLSVPVDVVAIPHNQHNGFIREDLQNFLIHNGEKSDIKKEFDQHIENSQSSTEKSIINNDQNNQNFNFELTQKLKNRINKSKHKNQLIENSQIHQPNTVNEDLTIGSHSLVKKNIITNPNVVKKSNSVSSKHSKSVPPSIGYLANELNYDRNPMPNLDAEVYAPGSNYSDHSNVMSTFLGDLPQSISNSDQSDFGDDESENSGGDLDVFHFDPQDCTEPVEV